MIKTYPHPTPSQGLHPSLKRLNFGSSVLPPGPGPLPSSSTSPLPSGSSSPSGSTSPVIPLTPAPVPVPAPAKPPGRATRAWRSTKAVIRGSILLLVGAGAGIGLLKGIDAVKPKSFESYVSKSDDDHKAIDKDAHGDPHAPGKTDPHATGKSDPHGDPHAPKSSTKTGGASPVSAKDAVIAPFESKLAVYYLQKAILIDKAYQKLETGVSKHVRSLDVQKLYYTKLETLKERRENLATLGVDEAFVGDSSKRPSPEQRKAYHDYLEATMTQYYETLYHISSDIIDATLQDPVESLNQQIAELKSKKGGRKIAEDFLKAAIKNNPEYQGSWKFELELVNAEKNSNK
ncbi:MAG: hypothetical protein K2X66_12920 [Cyanobacteria bacterium]|nr:hypothetical protein [Cyanobacteriota bacterium]